MGGGAEDDEDMPDGVVERMLFVAMEEISADGVEETFADDPPESFMRQALPERHQHDERYPTHDQIKSQRELRIFAQNKDLTDDAGDDACPEESEERPTHPSAQHIGAEQRIRAGYHDIDSDMIEDPQTAFSIRRRDGMIERGGKEHQQHSEEE